MIQIRVELHDVRQHDGIGPAVGQMELAANTVGDAVTQAQARRVKGQTCHAGSVVHLFTGQQILSVLESDGQPLDHQRNGLFCQRIREIVGTCGNIGFQRMGQHIHTAVCSHLGRCRDHQLRIQNGRHRTKFPARQRILDPLCQIRDHSIFGDFGAGTAGGGNCKAFLHLGIDIADDPARHHTDGLGRVNDAAAAHSDHHFRHTLLEALHTGRYHFDGRIRHHAAENRYFTVLQISRNTVGHTGLFHKSVRDDHDTLVMHFMQPFQRTFAKENTGTETEFLHRFVLLRRVKPNLRF